jgi:hypothetical protein
MLTIDERKIADPGTGAPPADGSSSFCRILVPVSAPDQSCPALAVAARICGMTGGVLRLVHVRICDPPLPIAGRLSLETAGDAAAVLEGGAADGLGVRRAAGHHGRGGCPALGCGCGDRVAGGRMAR